ncbi:FAR1-related sequence 5, partial [Prunus dulcis]
MVEIIIFRGGCTLAQVGSDDPLEGWKVGKGLHNIAQHSIFDSASKPFIPNFTAPLPTLSNPNLSQPPNLQQPPSTLRRWPRADHHHLLPPPAVVRCPFFQLQADPGLRTRMADYSTNIRDEIRRAYLQKGPCQPRSYKFPQTNQSGINRRFIAHWFDEHDWLEYSIAKDAVFCLHCYLFKSNFDKVGGDAFIGVGFNNWKKAKERFNLHVGQVGSVHNQAREFAYNLMHQTTHIETIVIKQTSQARMAYLTCLNASLKCTRYMLRQGLSFHCHDESAQSSNKRNYLELLQFLADHDEKVEAVVLENAPKNLKLIAHSVQKDLVNSCAKETIGLILSDVKDRYFLIMVDEARDVSIKEKMAMVLRYVNNKGQIIERFVGVQHVTATTSSALKEAIDEFFSSVNLRFSKLQGQGYDGASNMRGEFNGLKTKILREQPCAFYVHCFAHQLQLALVAVAKKNIDVNSFFTMANSLVNVVGASCKRRDARRAQYQEELVRAFEDDCLITGRGLNQETSFKRVGDTRWNSHYVLTMDEEYVIPGSSWHNAPMKTNYHGYRVEIFIHVIDGQLAELNDHFNERRLIQVENGETSTPKNKVTQFKAPYVGMVFETMEEARNYYEEYGRQEGFWIRTRSSSKTRRHLDMVTSRQFVCAHEGKYVPKNTSQKASEENDERDISEIENMKRTGRSKLRILNFFYAIQCDENERTANFFWVDARSRMAYHYFGDVVTFDTTYRTNKYIDMPFAPFTGVNHHLQSIQFGCALLQDETETWLETMGGHHPISIISDQDLAMKGAIAKIFPNTRHRKKFAEKLSHVYFKKSKFKIQMKKCIQSTYNIEEFEEKWKELMKECELANDDWLNSLYDIHSSWVAIYNHNIFFAGMNTTGRSEGIHSFFDGFVTPTTNLREYRIVNEGEFLLKHASKFYTRNVFNKFKDEWSKVTLFKVEEISCDDEYHAYLVKTKLGEHEEFVVKLNLQTYKVFVRLDTETLLDHFILPRWRQEANKFRIIDFKSLVTNDGKEESEAFRLSHMCHRATKLACIAASSNEAYTTSMEAINELSKKLSDNFTQHATIPSSIIGDPGSTNIDSSQLLLLDPNISQTKGRKKDNISSSKRIKSGIELAQNKKKRKCALCKKIAQHDKRNCPSNLKRRKNEPTNLCKLAMKRQKTCGKIWRVMTKNIVNGE